MGSPRGLEADVEEWDIVVSKFQLNLPYCIYTRKKYHGKSINIFILHPMS